MNRKIRTARRTFVKLTEAAKDYYRESDLFAGYEPLTDCDGVSMLDFLSYNDLDIEYHDRQREIEFFDRSFSPYEGPYSILMEKQSDGTEGNVSFRFVIDRGDVLYEDCLAGALGRTRYDVYAMQAAGFQMPDGAAKLLDALNWLAERPGFSADAYYKKGGTA